MEKETYVREKIVLRTSRHTDRPVYILVPKRPAGLSRRPPVVLALHGRGTPRGHISGGGMHTFFSTCLDQRIRACVISGYFCTFRDGILSMHHCMCNLVPGLSSFGETVDLAGLIAPRPLLVEAGSYDPIFPIRKVRASVAQARRAYDVLGARSAIQTDYFEGRHQIGGRLAYDFLARHLGL